MIYSVWQPARRDYDYYEGPDTVGTPEASHLSKAGVGMSPYRAAWPLPASARLVGRGAAPRGTIANTGAVSALGDIPNGVKSIIVVAIGGFLVWRWLR